MTTRRRIFLSANEAAALVEERKQIALRRAAAAIAGHLPAEQLRALIADLRQVGEAPLLLARLRKLLMRAASIPTIGGEARPDKAVWDSAVGGKASAVER